MIKKVLSLLLLSACLTLELLTIPKSELKELAAQFAPEIRFHKDEKYFPVDMNEYIKNCALQYRDPLTLSTKIIQYPPLSSTDLNNPSYIPKDYEAIVKNKPSANASLAERQAFEDTIFPPFDTINNYFLSPSFTDLNKKTVTLSKDTLKTIYAYGSLNPSLQWNPTNRLVPCYFHAEERPFGKGIVIQYIFMYAYQGPMLPDNVLLNLVPKIMDIGIHEGDVEHLDVYLQKIEGRYQIEYVYYSAHGSKPFGEMLRPGQNKSGRVKSKIMLVNDEGQVGSTLDHTHPIAYAAKYGHALHSQNIGFDAPFSIKNSWSALNSYIKGKEDIGYTFDTTSQEGPQWQCWKSPMVDLGTRQSPTQGQEWTLFNGRLGGTYDTVNSSVLAHLKKANLIFNNSPASPMIDNSWWRTSTNRYTLLTVTANPNNKKATGMLDLTDIIPTRMPNVMWVIEHPEAESIVFDINKHRTFPRKDSTIYDTLTNKRVTPVASDKQELYITNIRSLNKKPIEGEVIIKLIGLEE